MIPLSRPIVGEVELNAIRRVLESGQLAHGPEVESFEAQFAQYVGVQHAMAVANGTVALTLGLQAMGIGPGDEVIVPSFTFIATPNAVRLSGAVPVFADIDPDTFCISEDSIKSLVSDRTVAVIAVHLYGHPAPISALLRLCDARGLALVEDAAQALGSEWDGRHVGSEGAFGSFSFYPTKNITTGEGGMVTTSNPEIAMRVALLRNHGAENRYDHQIVGTNARMTEIAAAIGRVQLERLPEWNKLRAQNAQFYEHRLSDIVVTPQVSPQATHAYHQYTIRTPDRDRFIETLEKYQVGYGIYYERPCHVQKPYRASGRSLPETETASDEVLSIPVRPDLTPEERELVATAVAQGVGQ